MSAASMEWVAGWAGLLLATAAAAAAPLALARVPVRVRVAIVVLVVLAVILVPIGGTTPIAFLFGALGPLSLASVLAALLALAWLLGAPRAGTRALRDPKDLLYSAFAVVGLGLVLYPASLGLAPLDPYRWGFRGLVLPVILIGVALMGLALRSRIVPIWFSLAILAWLVRLSGSDNLWDYLIDPGAWTAALLFLLARGALALLPRDQRAGA